MRSRIVLKDANAEKFVANGHYSFAFVFTFSVVVVDQPTDCILSFLFPDETDVLVPVFSQSTDVVVVNFVVVLKFPNDWFKTSLKCTMKKIPISTLTNNYYLSVCICPPVCVSHAVSVFQPVCLLSHLNIKLNRNCQAGNNYHYYYMTIQFSSRKSIINAPALYWTIK